MSAISTTQSHRLAVVISHPTQYYSPWFRWLRQHTSLELRVFYLWEFGVTTQRDRQFQSTFKWDVDLLTGYEHDFVPNTARDPGTHHFGGLRNPDLINRLAAWRPSVMLVFGYKSTSQLRAITWARRKGIPLLFRGDSHLLGRGRPGTLARLALSLLYAQFDAVLTVGAANREYFLSLGVPEAKLFFAPHAVDHTRFLPVETSHHIAAQEVRAGLGITLKSRVILFAGKLLPAKQPRELLLTFLDLARPEAVLVFVGEGPEKSALQDLAARAPAGRVYFLPFANQSEMPSRYLLADLFVLPSRGHYETWGLAVNEAMHMGVPALVSDLVGCQRDLVTEGETGWVFSAGTPDTLRENSAVPSPRSRMKPPENG
jgi:glycosyltransferase involved in cell wall biosynthesis